MSFKKIVRLASLALLAGVLIAGCSGSNGSNGTNGTSGTNGSNGTNGTNGAPGLSVGSISGTVVDSVSLAPIAGATVAITPAVASNATTDAGGGFSFTDVPIGSYQAVVSISGYNQYTSAVIPVVAGVTSTTQLLLVHGPYQAPLISGLANQLNVGYGTQVTVTTAVSDPNNLSYTCAWTISSPLATAPALSNTTSCSSVSFTTDTFAALASMDPSLVDPVGGLLVNRDAIVPISYNEMGSYTLTLTAKNSKGVSSSSSITVRASDKQPGIENVAVGVPVYLNFIETTPNAQLTTVPTGSIATLKNVAASPYTVVTFTPDKAGVYNVTSSGSSFTIVAGTWDGVGQPVAGGYSNCVMCHSGSLTGNFAPWSQTPHASMFTNGINGVLGSHYGSSCEPCHTVGFDQASLANNNGFDDVAAQFGWTFPTSLVSTNWSTMEGTAPTVAALANIQCENCHGPSNSLAHGSSPQDLAERVGWTAGVCNQCHDAPTHHIMGTQWQQSPHAQYDLAMGEATIQNRGTTAAHCGRCHSAQGFGAYLDQIALYGFTGATNVLGFGTLTTSQLAAMGLTVSQVQPQTCQACHDPHDASLPHQLRIYDSTILAAGFTVNSVGAGAVCMQCHNQRNGLHNESVPLTYSTMFPHTPSQADILMGENAYFCGITGTTTIYVSKHANIADTCATCHMQYNPDRGIATYGHTFAIGAANQIDQLDPSVATVCANCHGTGVDGSGLQTEVQGLLNTIQTAILSDASAVINAASPLYLGNTQITAVPVTVTGFSGYGMANLTITDNNGTVYSSVAINTITTGTSTGYVFPIDGSNVTATSIMESIWNYSLVNNDGSLGIHNPTYVLTILNNTLNTLDKY